LRQLNNFNSLFAVQAAFQSNAVFRLKWTKAEIPASVLKVQAEIERLCSSSGKYKAFHEALGRVSGSCIPYLGVFLTELVYCDEGMKDEHEGLIHFHKRRQMYAIIANVQRYQQQPYNFVPVPQISALLHLRTPKLSEEELFNISLEREPKNATDASQLD